MPKGIQVSEDLRWAIVRMAPLVSIDIISLYTNVSRRQIRRILSLFCATGDVVRLHDCRLRGCPRHLSADDVVVFIFFLHGS
jgi:hypothetical protein